MDTSDEQIDPNPVVMLPTKKRHYTQGRLTSLQLLQTGNVEAFGELFDLLKKSRELREEARKRRERQLPVLLEDDEDTLNILQKALAEAEAAKSSGRSGTEYDIRMNLGHHFQRRSEDFWLSEHFYYSCRNVITAAKGLDGRKIIRALERLGYVSERKGALNEALKYLDDAFKFAEEKDLVMDEGIRHALHLITHRISMVLAERVLERGEKIDETPEQKNATAHEALRLFEKAYENAKLADAIESEAAAKAKIGMIMYHLKDYSAAIEHFTDFVRLCKKSKDYLGFCYGHLSLASIHESMGDSETSLSMLYESRYEADQNDFVTVLVPCCLAVGNIYTSQMRFEEADAQYSRAFNELLENSERFAEYDANVTRVLCGVGRGHVNFGTFLQAIGDEKNGVAKLMEWKSKGVNL